MTPAEVTALRGGLSLTQEQFASLLGVHSLTVSKWERGLLQPSPYQAALMQSFARSRQSAPDVGAIVGGVLLAAGVGAALYLLLKPAFEVGEPPARTQLRKARAGTKRRRTR